MKKISLLFLPILILSCVLLIACGGGDTTTTTTTTSPTSTSPTTTVKSGGTLKLYGTDPATLDPAVASDSGSHEYIIQIFSGLLKFDENMEPAADIASSWDPSPDGRTFTFHLRDDVTFQDGRQVTAADFKYSWERACDPATGSNTAGPYLGDIVGVKEKLAGGANEISGVRVVNDYTLEVTIDAPKSYFLSRMTYPTSMVVDRFNVEQGGEWWRTPNGTGPFKLKEWQQSSLLVLERNDSYFGQIASLKSVEFQMYSGLPMDLYETGQIDVSGAYVDYIDRITDKEGPFYNDYHISPELSFSYIGFNIAKPPFDDVNIRKAFTMAIDKDKIVSLTLRDLLKRADGILPPGIPGYNENLAGLGFDVDKAKELIAASKYGSAANLPPITLTTAGYGVSIDSTLEAIIAQWRDNLGVEVKVRQLEPDWFVYHLKEEKDNMFITGWIADYPHPQDFLDVLFRTGVENNYSEYSNPALDILLDQAAVEKDTEKSLVMYQHAEQIIVEDAAVVPLWFGQNHMLVKPYVVGYELNALGYVMLNKVSILEH